MAMQIAHLAGAAFVKPAPELLVVVGRVGARDAAECETYALGFGLDRSFQWLAHAVFGCYIGFASLGDHRARLPA